MPGRGGWRETAGAALVLTLTLALCVGRAGAETAAPPVELPRIAILPFTNLSGTPDAAQAFELLLTTALAEVGPVTETGRVGAAMDSLRIRPTMSPYPGDLFQLRAALGVRYLVLGSVLEHTMVHTPDSQFPCSGVVLKILDADSSRILWAGSRYRCGDDKESFFGWGRDFDPTRVAMRLTSDLAHDVRRAIWPTTERDGKGNSR